MSRRKIEIKGQLELFFKPEQNKSKPNEQTLITPEKLQELTEYVIQNNGTSIGNLMRVFHYSSMDATICFNKLAEIGIINKKGMLIMKKKKD